MSSGARPPDGYRTRHPRGWDSTRRRGDVEIEEWGEEHLDFLRTFLPFEHAIPSHDALNDLVNALDPELFKTCFVSWVETLRDDDPEIIGIDGKTSRRTHDRRKGREPLHLVSAWAARQRLVLAQQAVDEKSNEIVAIPLLLQRLALKGGLVTIDAIGTQREIAAEIIDGGGDYCMALKGSHPLLHAEVERFFIDPRAEISGEHTTLDGDHGRIEERRHVVAHGFDWLLSDRRYADEPRFPGLAMIGMVEARVERNGKTSTERRYYLCSARLEAATFARAVRAHWGVENRLHWVLDVVFHDDLARLRSGHGPENMAIIRHTAMNLIRSTRATASLKVRRKKAAWNTAYLADVLRGAA